jgi:hypothetical protein
MLWNQVLKSALVATLATSALSTPTGGRVTKRDTEKYVFAHFMVKPLDLNYETRDSG